MSTFDGSAPDFAPEYTPRRKVSTYRLEVQAKPDTDTDALLTSLKTELSTQLAGSGLGSGNTLSILFRCWDDEMALAQLQDLEAPHRHLIAATVLSTGQGVNYREVEPEPYGCKSWG